MKVEKIESQKFESFEIRRTSKEKKTKTSSTAASIPALDEDSSRDQYYKNFIVVLTASPIPVSMLDFEA